MDSSKTLCFQILCSCEILCPLLSYITYILESLQVYSYSVSVVTLTTYVFVLICDIKNLKEFICKVTSKVLIRYKGDVLR